MPLFRSFSVFLVFLTVSATTAVTDVPYPTCEDAGCRDPADFGSYLRLEASQLPDDFHSSSSSTWKYLPGSGLNIVGAWRVTTGRPDVVIAVLDSGVR